MYSIFLRVFAGDIMGILSDNHPDLENMLGIVSGRKKIDYGRVYLKETLLREPENLPVLKEQVTVVSSKAALIPNLTIAQNMFAIQRKTNIFFRKKESEFKLRKYMDLFGIRLSVDTPVKKLDIVQRIELEILKAWLLKHPIILLDLRSIYLSEEELQTLKRYLCRYRNHECAVLIFDQNINRLFFLTDKISVLSGGKTIGNFLCEEQIRQKLLKLYLSPKAKETSAAAEKSGKKIFSLEHVNLPGLPELNFSVRAGETVILQVPDWRASEKLIALFKGEIQQKSGEIWIGRNKYQAKGAANGPKQSLVVMEPPYLGSLFYNLNVYDNFCIARGCIRKGLWSDKKCRQSVREYIRKIFGRDISERKLSELSPGETQKLVWFRWIFYAPAVLVCADPFDSADMSLRSDVEEYLSLLAGRGTALVLIARSDRTYSGIRGRCIRITDIFQAQSKGL